VCLLEFLLLFMHRRRRRDRLVLHPSGCGTFLHADLMGRSDIIKPFPHPEHGGVMRQHSDNPYLFAGAGAIGADEGCKVGCAKSRLSSPLQSSGVTPRQVPNRI
jgi:hypothetical protein